MRWLTRVCVRWLQGVSLLAPSFAICCSPLNATLGEKEACLKLAASTDYQSAPLEAGGSRVGHRDMRTGPLGSCAGVPSVDAGRGGGLMAMAVEMMPGIVMQLGRILTDVADR